MSSKVFYRAATIAVTALAMSGLQSPLRAEYFKSFNRDKRGATGNDASQVAFFLRHSRGLFLFQRRARGSNPQPVSRHHISSCPARLSATVQCRPKPYSVRNLGRP
jgi:hypothetical protein